MTGSNRLAIGAHTPVGSLSNMAGAVGFDPTPQRFKGAHATITPSPYCKRKHGNPGWYRSNDSAVRARRFSISLRGITLVGEPGIEPGPRRFQRPAMTTSATHPNLKMAEGGGIDPHTVARTERFPGGSGTPPGSPSIV